MAKARGFYGTRAAAFVMMDVYTFSLLIVGAASWARYGRKGVGVTISGA